MNIRDTILEYRRKNPDASYEEICAFVKKKNPGCRTTPASVACTISRNSNAAVSRNEPSEAFDELPETDPEETIEDAKKRIALRYEAMERMAKLLVAGKIPSLIVSGPPGMSKSYTLDDAIKASQRTRHDGVTPMEDADEDEAIGKKGYYDKIAGTCTAVGLFHALWNMRNGGVVYLDDCDAVFRDEDALNILKVATDSTRERLLSWRKNSPWLEEYGIDKTFEFRGHIVFLTNIDFEKVIEKGHKDSEHFKALIDRARYLCLTLRTRRDFMLRIRAVAEGKDGMLMKHFALNEKQVKELLDYVDENQTRFYNLSLRLVGQIAVDMKNSPKDWKRDTEATKMKTT